MDAHIDRWMRRGTLTAVIVVALLAATEGAWAGRADAAPIVNPPTFESVIAGDGDHIDAATGLQVGADGSLYACGFAQHDVTGYDITVTRFAEDPLGWTRTWNGPADTHDQAVDIAVAPDGSVYVLGTEGLGQDGKPLLLKYSAPGDLVWEARRPYGSPSQLAIDAGGHVYALGGEDNAESGGRRMTLVKYEPDGAEAWTRTYQTRGYKTDTSARDLLVTASGASYVVGTTLGVDFKRRAFVASWTSDGTRRWVKLYDGPGGSDAGFVALAKSPAGGVYAVGTTQSDASDILVTRYRADGSRALTRRLGVGDAHDQWAADVAVDSAERIVICGGWRRGDRGFYVAALRKDGAVAWSHNYAGDRTGGSAKLLAVDAAGRVVVAGNGRGARIDGRYAAGPVKVYALNAAGALRWTSAWPVPLEPGLGPHTLGVDDIAVWQTSDVWVCGTSDDRPGTGPDQLVLGWALR